MNSDVTVSPRLPVVEEVNDALWEAVSGGQPVLLVHAGEPSKRAVVLDYESWQEVEELANGE